MLNFPLFVLKTIDVKYKIRIDADAHSDALLTYEVFNFINKSFRFVKIISTVSLIV